MLHSFDLPNSAAASALASLPALGNAAKSKTNGAASSSASSAAPTGQTKAAAADSYADYEPSKLTYGPAHVEHVVESASLACVSPTDVTLTPKLPAEVLSNGVLSRVQLEAVVYALQQHERKLPSGARAGFFIGDGTGVGKGRELAAIIWDNWRRGRRKAVWFTCNADLAVDARRDLNDIGATDVPLQTLAALPYDAKPLKEFPAGVMLVTYSCLVAKSSRMTRYEQLKAWLGGSSFDGVLAFDEAHKAKGAVHGQPVGKAVSSLQEDLPSARVVYLSATGATKVQDLSYMTRLGLWGPGTFFANFRAIEAALGISGGAGAMEMLSVQLKASGAYLARNLGLRGVDFHLEQAKLSVEQAALYDASAQLWVDMWQELTSLSPVMGLHPGRWEAMGR